MNIRRKLRAHTEVHTGPLNDILFILLLFFLIASTLANPNLIRVNNPRGTKDTKAKQNIIVSIDKNHQFFLGTQHVPESSIDSLLKEQIRGDGAAGILVTHSEAAARTADRVFRLQSGTLQLHTP